LADFCSSELLKEGAAGLLQQEAQDWAGQAPLWLPAYGQQEAKVQDD